MDWASIISALIGGGVTLLGVLITNAKQQAVMEERISNLTKQVEKHNSIVERTYRLESDMGAILHRIDELSADIHK